MGFFSKIWKGVTKGIMTVFSPILKPLAKMMATGWGKALMLALSIFTMGTALVAAQGAFAAAQTAGQGFISAFVEGGKVFLKTMLGMDTGAEAGAEAGAAAAGGAGPVGPPAPGAEMITPVDPGAVSGGVGSSSVAPVDSMADQILANAQGGAPEGLRNPPITGSGTNAVKGPPVSAKGVMPPPSSGAPPPGITGATPMSGASGAGAHKEGLLKEAAGQGFRGKAPPKEGNWLTRAAKKGWEYANTDLGSGILEGIGYAMEFDERRKHDARFERMWNNPNSPGISGIQEFNDNGFESPKIGENPYGRTLQRNRRGHQMSVGFNPSGG